MPVGTLGSVKSLTTDQLKQLGSDVRDRLGDDVATGPRIILNNTYHLMLRPGVDLLERFGGVHRFEGWVRAILTDSGRFQLFSLASLRKIREEGVELRSHLDGHSLLSSAEKAEESPVRVRVVVCLAC